MRIYFIILFCFLSVFGYSQTGFPIEQNIGSKVTNTRTEGTFGSYTGFTFLKNYIDTIEANSVLYVKYTPGILIRVSDTLWIRNRAATAWLPIGSGSSAVSGADNGLSLSGSNIGLGGSTVSKVTNIWLRNYPIRFIRDSIQLSTQSDSNAIILSNRKPATATSDSLITPQIVFSVNGWQFNPGPTPDTSRNARFSISAVGADGANSYLALRGKAAGTSEINLLRIRANGGIIDNLYVNSQNIGIYGTNNLVFGSGGMGSTGITTSSVSGISNQAIGITALHSITSGSYNTAIGSSTLYNFKDGIENTALGYNAMFASDSTNHNTAIGSYALFYNTRGYQLTAVGKNALYSNTVGIKNTGIGAGAFEASDSGSFNSGVGHDTYYQLSIGDNNVGLGWRAGGSIVNGSNNIMIGTDAGFSASQQDTVDNTILIGYGLYSTKSNQMILGNSAITETQINGLSVGSSTDSVMVYDATNKIVKYRNASYFSGGGGSYWPLGVGASLTSDVTMDVSSKVLQFGGIFSLFKQDDNNGRIDLVGTGRLLLQHDTVNLTTSLQAYDTTNNKPLLIDASGNIRKGKWFYAGTGGTGTNNTNGGSAYRWLLPGTQVIKTYSATSPLVLDSATSNQIGITINNAAADGSTKGAASFTASDFNSSSGNISIDYTNGQKATSSQPGFMTAAYAQKLDSNYYIQTPVVDNYLVGKKLNDSTLYIRKLLAGSNITLTLSGDTAISIASSGGGAGTNNANIGSGYRWLLPGTQEIKTAFAGLYIIIDSSSNTNGLTFKVDSSTLLTNVRSIIASSVPGSNGNLIINRNGLFAAPGSDSINWSAGNLNIKGTLTTVGTITSGASQSIYSGGNVVANSGNSIFFGSVLSNVGYVNGPITISPLQALIISPGNSEQWRFNTSANGGTLTNTGGVGSAKLHFTGTGEQLRFGYDGSNYLKSQVNSTGTITWDLVGTSPTFNFSDKINAVGGLRIPSLSTGVSGDSLLVTETGDVKAIAMNAAIEFTPTLTGLLNVASTGTYTCNWSQYGDEVKVWGMVDVTPTASGTLTQIDFTLPVSSAISYKSILAGSGYSVVQDKGVMITGNPSTNKAIFEFQSASTSVHTFAFIFTYKYMAP